MADDITKALMKWARYQVVEGKFLGHPISDWIDLKRLADQRDITIKELAARYERLDPREHEEWRRHFGILAEIAEING